MKKAFCCECGGYMDRAPAKGRSVHEECDSQSDEDLDMDGATSTHGQD